jgi:hypothetical protein
LLRCCCLFVHSSIWVIIVWKRSMNVLFDHWSISINFDCWIFAVIHWIVIHVHFDGWVIRCKNTIKRMSSKWHSVLLLLRIRQISIDTSSNHDRCLDQQGQDHRLNVSESDACSSSSTSPHMLSLLIVMISLFISFCLFFLLFLYAYQHRYFPFSK